MEEKVQSAAARLLKEWVRDYEIAAIGSSFYALLNYEREQRGNVRRQMKLLMDEMRIQGGILRDFAATMALGEAQGAIASLDESLKNARLLIEERLVAGVGKLLEGKSKGGGAFAGSEQFAEFNQRKPAIFTCFL